MSEQQNLRGCMADSPKSKIMWSQRFLVIYTLVKLKVSAFLPKKRSLVKLNSSWWLSHPYEEYARQISKIFETTTQEMAPREEVLRNQSPTDRPQL